MTHRTPGAGGAPSRASGFALGLAFVGAWSLGAPSGTAQTTDLTLDTELAVEIAPGGTATAELVGPATSFALLGADVDPGPIALFGQTVPLGAGPSLILFPFNATDGSGVATWPVGVPSNASLVGLTLYFAGAVADVSHPSGFRVSNGAVLEIVDVPPVQGEQLSGRPIPTAPRFSAIDVFQTGEPIRVALDVADHPYAAGKLVDIYLVAARTAMEWNLDTSLVDVSTDGPESFRFTSDSYGLNIVQIEPGLLSGSSGAELSIGYDIVIDVDRDGELGDGDVIDGIGNETGTYIVPDLSLSGPYAVTNVLYSGPTEWLREDIFYPSNVASLAPRPLVVISHGNGHDYQWYDHLGNHLASWGYVVMSHRNNTGAGVQAAATTTLDNLEHFLGNLPTIAPALVGNVDTTRIGLLGHSRGGEGVVIAYHRLFTGAVVPANYTVSGIRVVSSIAPTYFQFMAAMPGTSHDVPYHAWVGAADADVTGCGSTDVAQPMAYYGWALGARSLIQIQGAGHGAFHNGGGSTVATGPCLLTRAEVHAIMRTHALALFGTYLARDRAVDDFLEREWSEFKPLGAPTTACAVVHVAHSDGPIGSNYVLDDFQSEPSLFVASSTAAVDFTVTSVAEGALIDDTNFTANGSEPFNAFTHGSNGGPPNAAVFSFGSNPSANYRYELPFGSRDVSAYGRLAFMLAQASRHSNTVALGAKVRFELRLTDEDGNSFTTRGDRYGDGVGQPYARSSCGSGTGWAAEFESFHIPLADFTRDGTGVDLTKLRYVEFLFGSSHGSGQGRLAIDQVEFTPF